MTTKKHVGLDFDDVLASCGEQLINFHNNNYGTNHKKQDATTYHLNVLWGISQEESYRRIHEFYDSQEHKNMAPLNGVIDGLLHLSKKYEISIVTARPPEAKEVTHELLKQFPEVFKKIHFIGTVTWENIKTTKAKVCEEENIDIFVEDNLTNALKIADAGIPSLLLDQPWNQEDNLPKNVTRVYSWEEILVEIDRALDPQR